jgi:hypothetical protein
MRRLLLLSAPLLLVTLLTAGLSGGCSKSVSQTAAGANAVAGLPHATTLAGLAGATRTSGFAALADRGNLVAYPAQRVVRKETASTWYRADVSEAHAMRSIVTGEMTVTAPDGQPVRLRYERHIEHPNGNWTWIGRDANGEDAVLTFGEKAVFGSIPQGGREELKLATLGGHSWMVQAVPGKQLHPDSKRADYVVPPELAASLASAEAADTSEPVQAQAAAAAAVATTVDVALGYTTGFAAELGGDSQAVTRLQNLVDITNQAYANSQINAQVRLVKTIAVSFPDATSNDDTLTKLSGYKSGSGFVTPDPAFSALRAARDQYGADLVSIVRRFRTPENDGCGLAWLIGGGQTRIDNSDAPFGYSVVSDDLDRGDLDETDHKTYVCRKETLAHELGHNMGQQHNVEDSGGDTGAHAYSYGYREASITGFYTVMAYRLPDSSQRNVRYFANPNVAEALTGRPTGVANTNDNARSMVQTMPLIAQFRATVVPPPVTKPFASLYSISKLGGGGFTDMHVLTGESGYQAYSLQTPTSLGQTGTSNVWQFALNDLNRDGVPDLYCIYRQGASGHTEIYVLDGARNYRASLMQVATVLPTTGTGLEWAFMLGDYNRDGVADLYTIYRIGASGMTEVHVVDGATNFQTYLAHIATALGQTGTANAWQFELADRNGDGVLDLYCINRVGAQRTEVHVLDGASNFQVPLLQVATALSPVGTGYEWDFKLGDYDRDGVTDLYTIYRIGASGKTELHVLDGKSNFAQFSAHIATVLPATGTEASWEFELWPQ